MGVLGERGPETSGRTVGERFKSRERRSLKIAFFSGDGKTKNFFRTFLPRRREKNGEEETPKKRTRKRERAKDGGNERENEKRRNVARRVFRRKTAETVERRF